MAVTTETFNADGSQKIFTPASFILSESHVRIDYTYADPDGIVRDHSITSDSWDIINNSVVFREAPTSPHIVSITISTDGSGLETSPSAVTQVAGFINELLAVYDVVDAITILSSVTEQVADLAPIKEDITQLAVASTDITNVSNITSDIQELSAIITELLTVATNIQGVKDVHNNLQGILTATANALQVNADMLETARLTSLARDYALKDSEVVPGEFSAKYWSDQAKVYSDDTLDEWGAVIGVELWRNSLREQKIRIIGVVSGE